MVKSKVGLIAHSVTDFKWINNISFSCSYCNFSGSGEGEGQHTVAHVAVMWAESV